MAYTTVSEVRSSTGMTDSSLVLDAYITAKIAMADGIINSRIGDVYVLPLSGTSPFISALALEIASALVLIDQYSEEAQDTDKNWEKRYKMALNQLIDIQKLKAKLYDANGIELSRNSLLSPSFYPTEASSDPSAADSTAAKITINKKW